MGNANAKAQGKTLRDEYRNAVPLTGTSDETFKWDAPGRTLKGRFLRLRDGAKGGSMVLIDTGTEVVVASAPTGVVDALEGVKPGTMVVIRYTGDRPPKRAGDSPFKVFEAVALNE